MTNPKKFNTIPDARAICRRIRVRKEDSAYVYCILESHEGIVSYSTLDSSPGDPHRDLELMIPVDFVQEVEELLRELGDLVYDLDTSENA